MAYSVAASLAAAVATVWRSGHCGTTITTMAIGSRISANAQGELDRGGAGIASEAVGGHRSSLAADAAKVPS